MLLMRKHNLLKVGLTPPYRMEEEDAHSSQQLAKLEEALAVSCLPCITFREEDAQLGTKNHNRPSFVSGYIRDHKINRILVDCGSAVNILPIRTMKNVGLSTSDLSPSSLLIQGFNQEGQRMLGSGIICRRQILSNDQTDSQIVTLAEPGAKCQEHSDASCIAQTSDASYVYQTVDASWSPKQTTTQVLSPKQLAHNNQLTHGHKPAATTPLPTQRNEKGRSSLGRQSQNQLTLLTEKVTLPLPKLEERSIVKQFPNLEQLPSTRSNEGFDPNAYRLMARAGGNFTKDQLREKPPVALPVLTPEQEKLRNEGRRITQGRLGLGYQKEKSIKIYRAQTKPIKITRKTSAYVNQVSVDHTSAKMKADPKPVIIYTLKVAIARARAYDSVMVNHISVDDDCQEDDDFVLKEAPTTFEEGGQSTIDELKKVDLGTAEDLRPTFLSTSLSAEEEVEYMSLLHEYRDIFAWNYTEMPGLDPRVAVHKLAVHPSVRPVKQSQRRFRPELVPEIKKEVDKLIAANFIREVKYPSWITNIVPVKKKNGQIRDEELTAFCTPKGIFCYKVMPFGFKNAGATYLRAMQNIFYDFLHKCIECYVDDLVVKSKERSDHLLDLRAVFERLQRFLKCAFGVTSRKFLGFVVHHRGIEIDQNKIDAIQKMPEPRNITELKSFQCHLAYIRRFISNLAERYQPVSRLMKKDTPFEWDESCRNAFNNIKVYLTKPSVLVAPIVDRPLLLYIASQEKSVGALLAQCDEDNKERSLYYLSRTLVGAELNYTPIEKTCHALIFAIQKLRHYLLAQSTNLILRADPMKYIIQALANFLADHPVPTEWELTEEFPDEEIFLVEVLPPWEMYFDSTARRNRASAGVLFVSPSKDMLPYSFVLTPNFLNNEAEYQAILLGLGMSVEMKLPQLNIYDDSALVIKQLTGDFTPHVPRSENGPADALAGITANLPQFDERPSQVPICERWVIPPPAEEETEEEQIEEMEESFPISAIQNEAGDWREPIVNFLRYGTLPVDLRERVQICRTAPRYVFINDKHTVEFAAHTSLARSSTYKLSDCYWPKMLRDATEMARTCRPCQLHADYIHQPPEALHPTIASWPFEAWGMDIIGPITPNSDSDRQYILAATDYFSKWPKAAAYREVKATTIANRIRTQIIYRYGVPRGAVLPLEVQLPSLRIAIREGLTIEECGQLRLAELESLDELRLEAQQRLECYQSRMTWAFNKKVRLSQTANVLYEQNWEQVCAEMGRTVRGTGSLHQWRLQASHFKRFGAADNER
ncbi:hypothetical protein H6P81_018058 [Aristolochia fimbriata]|uniref:Reverse transcriptase n=1 Tax=Aristolochia fimbriata TaxID=158543 RepID=A0AAV7E0A5_ARIFI|nr:hypothetical protein H6P81_018058 [Aristolochia fimbriata]